MASQAPVKISDATAAATESIAKLFLDEKTGDMVSKSELKKREKKRLQDAKKVAKNLTTEPKTRKSDN